MKTTRTSQAYYIERLRRIAAGHRDLNPDATARIRAVSQRNWHATRMLLTPDVLVELCDAWLAAKEKDNAKTKEDTEAA